MKKREKIIVVCGGFDPLSIEDLYFLKACKRNGDWLIVGVHSDWWMGISQGGSMQSYDTRREIIRELKCVDEVMDFNDSDGTVCQILKLVKILYPNSDITYVSEFDMINQPESNIRGITFAKLTGDR
jgi:glycerol-3-phosphate cytidylyltransferase-like family protein